MGKGPGLTRDDGIRPGVLGRRFEAPRTERGSPLPVRETPRRQLPEDAVYLS